MAEKAVAREGRLCHVGLMVRRLQGGCPDDAGLVGEALLVEQSQQPRGRFDGEQFFQNDDVRVLDRFGARYGFGPLVGAVGPLESVANLPSSMVFQLSTLSDAGLLGAAVGFGASAMAGTERRGAAAAAARMPRAARLRRVPAGRSGATARGVTGIVVAGRKVMWKVLFCDVDGVRGGRALSALQCGGDSWVS
ncbi:hypothetical protein [Streptomyces sp. UNOC14_S4]|uniref:hypothetical protein n=1 Tax=Streptomyces sp. UNOC14_S4 TaxID=2872340 RepID=UPI001E3947E6|nr:hypothetical protein [Streptomyces sp. UNOC14_S4]MCC3769761.1 hypothetical protein [Streptomyces sp. UNOC14_S4]